MENKRKLTLREERVVEYVRDKNKYFKNTVHQYQYGKTSGITVKECIDVLGTTELRKIISNLRYKGFRIVDIWETDINRFGDEIRYKRYLISREAR